MEERTFDFTVNFAKKLYAINCQLDELESNKRKLGILEKVKITKLNIDQLQVYLQDNIKLINEFNVNTKQISINNSLSRCENLIKQMHSKSKFVFQRKNKKSLNQEEDMKFKLRSERQLSNFNSCLISNLSSQLICLNRYEVSKKDVSLDNLTKCLIQIHSDCDTLIIKNLQNSIVVVGPIRRAALIENCLNTKIALISQQLRIHSSYKCFLNISVATKIILEDSRKISFSNYSYNYDGLNSEVERIPLNLEPANISDFDWLSIELPSPNWKFISNICDWENIINNFKHTNNLL